MNDVESYLLAIRSFLQTYLNTAIVAMNTEKNDSIVLDQVNSAAYSILSLNNDIINYDPYIVIQIDDILSVSDGPGTIQAVVFSVVLVIQDQGETLEMGRKILRYHRILNELMNSGFNKIAPHATFKVNSLVPVALTKLDTNDPYRAVGVQIVVSLG